MKKSLTALAALAAAVSMAGCETLGGSDGRDGASVTRFHLGQPIARGEIRVEPADPARANSLEFTQMAASVERELARLGWNVARGNATSEQVAVIRIDQGSREAMRSRSSVSIGVGAGSGGWGRSGVGGGVSGSIPIGGASSGEIVVTELAVRIQRRSDATAMWEGRAEIEARADSPLSNPVAAVDRLAEAMFRDFPGESGQTIRVR